MKCIIRSIKPYWFYLILERIKTIEVGKNKPKQWEGIPVFLYCTKDQNSFNRIPKQEHERYRKYIGKVGACFIPSVMHFIPIPFPKDIYSQNILNRTCLTEEELNTYGKDYKNLVGWDISNLVTIEEPKSIEDFYKTGFDTFNHFYAPVNTNEWKIKSPPQSWFTAEYF